MLRICENETGYADVDLVNGILHHTPPEHRYGDGPTRAEVAAALRQLFGQAFVYVGGCHVAAHQEGQAARFLLVTGTSPDWK